MTEKTTPYRRPEFAAALVVGVFLLLLMPWQRMLTGQNDFVHLYVYGALSGTPDLHSGEATAALQKRLIGAVFEYSYFLRPTFYGVFAKPLAWMPYPVAYAVFQTISVASFLVFVRFHLPALPQLPVLCAMSVPLLSCFVNGQDVTLLLLFCSVSLWLARRKRDVLAGMVMALCTIKLHFFVLAPVAMLLHKRYRIFYGGVIGCLLLFGTGLASGGIEGERRLLELMLNPGTSPLPDIMPSMRALFGERQWLYFATVPIVGGACIWAIRKAPTYEAAIGWSLLGGLLLSFHAYAQDCLLLLLALATIAPGAPRRLRIALTLPTLPPFYILLLIGAPYSAALPLAMVICVAIAVLESTPPATKPVFAATA